MSKETRHDDPWRIEHYDVSKAAVPSDEFLRWLVKRYRIRPAHDNKGVLFRKVLEQIAAERKAA